MSDAWHRFTMVALRKESVDRNVNLRVLDGSKSVALRKESVDRNGILSTLIIGFLASLSARRAWIEICPVSAPYEAPTVALRKESVDRNIHAVQIVIVKMGSLSARRAWIEIRHM